MKQRLLLFGQLGLFWMLYFTIGRIFFLIFHFSLTNTLTFADVLTIIALGSRMDAAIAGDCLLLTGLLLAVSCINNWKFIGIANHVIVAAFITTSAIIIVADLELYRHWGFRMDNTPLMYLGSEGAGSISGTAVTVLTILFFTLVVPAWLMYWKKIAPRFRHLPEINNVHAITMLVVTGLLIIPIRSSFSVAPLNTGVVYYHKTNAFANHAGINVIWNFFASVSSSGQRAYPKDFYDPGEAERIIKELNEGSHQTHRVVNAFKPNVLLIVLESFTARVIEPLGGVPGITPNLNRLVHDGILFDNFYASGDRTDKGIVAILSGYPAQPQSSIIKHPSKTQNLPFLSSSLNQLGYHTSFVYGGDIGFANMESYVTTAGFSHVTDDDDFPSSMNTSKWGVQDHLVFDRLLEECDTAQGPFFKMMLSLSSHEPFDVPLDPPFKPGHEEVDMFLNACYYTDKSLGEFITKAKTKDWWKNTLVIITADHGHRFPDTEELQDKGRFRIPMLWLGGAITKSDTIIHTTGGQTDIANSILAQVDTSSEKFRFSKDLLDQNVYPYAVFIFHNGYGYVDGVNDNIYDFDLGDYVKGNDVTKGRAYMQCLFTDYNAR